MMAPKAFAARFTWFLLALTIFASLASANFAASQTPSSFSGHIIPFEYNPLTIPVPVIRMRINGSAPLPFIVDTGCSQAMLLDQWAADQLKLSVDGRKVHLSLNQGEVQEARLQSVLLLKKGDGVEVKIPLASAFVGNLEGISAAIGGQRIAGIVGIPLLADATARFNFMDKTMTLYPHPYAPAERAPAVSLPIKKEAGGNRYYVAVAVQDKVAVDLMIDTGSGITGLPQSLLSRVESSGVTGIETMTFGGSYRSALFLISGFRIGDFVENDVALSSEKDLRYAVLGTDLLSRFHVTFDFPNQRMLLERAENYPEAARIYGHIGIELLYTADGYRVRSVKSEFAAAEAGVTTGDRVLKVDGTVLSGMPAAAANRLINGFAGTRARLQLEKPNGHRVEVVVPRVSAFTSTERGKGGLGFSVAPDAARKLLIVEVEDKSPAHAAGLKVGDEIVAINDVPVKSMTLAEMLSHIRKPEGTIIKLKVIAKDTSEVRTLGVRVREL